MFSTLGRKSRVSGSILPYSESYLERINSASTCPLRQAWQREPIYSPSELRLLIATKAITKNGVFDSTRFLSVLFEENLFVKLQSSESLL